MAPHMPLRQHAEFQFLVLGGAGRVVRPTVAISKVDAISGTIYVIASDADEAQRMAIGYLLDNEATHGIHDKHADARGDLHNRYSSFDPDRERVYAVSLDIRVANEK